MKNLAVSLGNFPDFDFTILACCRVRAGIDDAAKHVTKAAWRKLFEIATSGSAVFNHQSEI